MIFNKKRDNMIDLTKNQKRLVKTPAKQSEIPTNSQGFIEINKSQSNADFFGFTNSTPKKENSFSTETDGYNKREVDTKITNLDNKIYKLEQRLELIEKKLDINQSNNGALIGW